MDELAGHRVQETADYRRGAAALDRPACPRASSPRELLVQVRGCHRGYHLLAVPTWERKIRVLAVWLTAALFGRDIVSLASVQHPREAFIAGGEPASPPSGVPSPYPDEVIEPIGRASRCISLVTLPRPWDGMGN
jgi:hypothetical protein